LNSDKGVEIRRFFVEENSSTNFELLLNKIRHVFGSVLDGYSIVLCWKDEDGDNITFSSDEELICALNSKENETFKIYITSSNLENSPTNPFPNQNELFEHPGITCDACDGPVRGIRYKCTVCPDFDLCENCEKKSLHGEHPMLRICDSTTLPIIAPSEPVRNQKRKKNSNVKPYDVEEFLPPHIRRQYGCRDGPWGGPGCHFWKKKHLRQMMNHCRNSQFDTAGKNGKDSDKIISSSDEENIAQDTNEENFQELTQRFSKLKCGKENKLSQKNRSIRKNENLTRKINTCKERLRKLKSKQESIFDSGELETKSSLDENSFDHLDGQADEENSINHAILESGDPKLSNNHHVGLLYPRLNSDGSPISSSQPLVNAANNFEMKNAFVGEPSQRHSSNEPEEWMILSKNVISAPTATTDQEESVLPPHPNPQVNKALAQLKVMGFTDEGGWLTKLLETKNGDINQLMDVILPCKK